MRLADRAKHYLDDKLRGWPLARSHSYPNMQQPTLTITRDSEAYKNDGTSVAHNAARFETGGVTVEEGTTNIAKNPFFVGTYTAGVAAQCTTVGAGSTTTENTDTTYIKYGNKSQHITTGATEGGIGQLNISITAGQSYTVSALIYVVSGTIRVRAYKGDWTGAYEAESSGTGWQTLTIPARTDYGTQIHIYIINKTTVASEYYIDALQIENKAYATSFTDSTRAAEVLTVPTSGVLNPSEGTIEMVINATDYFNMSNDRFILKCYSVGNVNAIQFFKYGSNNKIYFQIYDSSSNSSQATSNTALANGQHRIAVKYGRDKVSMFVDGTEQSTKDTTVSLPASLYSTIVIASAGTLSQIDTQISDVHIHASALPDSVLAARGATTPLPILPSTTAHMALTSDLTATANPGSNGRCVLDLDIAGSGIPGVLDSPSAKALSFTRATTAYKDDGTSVTSGTPRFESRGMTIEEGTTNLVTNPFMSGTYVGGVAPNWTKVTATCAENTNASYLKGYSAKSQKVTCANIYEGIKQTGITVSNATAYTASVLVYLVSGKARLVLKFSTAQQIQVTATAGWNILTATQTSDGTSATVTVDSYDAASSEFYLVAAQLEAKAYSTSMISGTRNAEVVTVPTAGVLSPSQGTVEMLVNVTAQNIVSSSINYLFQFTTNIGTNPATNNVRAFFNNGKIWLCSTDATPTQSSQGNNATTGLHRFSFKWSSTELITFIDGVKQASWVANPKIPAALPTNLYLGSDANGIAEADTQISDIVISSRARTDTELAARGVLTPLGCDKDTTWYAPLTSTVAHQCPSTGASKILDRSGFNRHGTNTGTVKISTPSGTGISFRRTSDNPRIDCGTTLSPSYNSQMSWSAWIKPLILTSDSINTRLFSTKTDANNWYNCIIGATGEIYFYVVKDGVSYGTYKSGSNILVNNVYHLVITWATGTNPKIYLNGSVLATVDGTSATSPAYTSFTIGTSAADSARYYGELYDFKAFNYALTASEVKQLYENTRWRYC